MRPTLWGHYYRRSADRPGALAAVGIGMRYQALSVFNRRRQATVGAVLATSILP